jgi:hypothetical protein
MKSACWLLVYEDELRKTTRFGYWHYHYKFSLSRGWEFDDREWLAP